MITCPHCGQEFSAFYTAEAFPQATDEVVMTIVARAKCNRSRACDPDEVAQALIANPLKGHRFIAKMCGVSRTTVYRIARARGIVQRTCGIGRASHELDSIKSRTTTRGCDTLAS